MSGTDWDINNRTCRLDIAGVVHAETGHAHEVTAGGELLIGSVTSTGEIKFDCADCHFDLAFFKYDGAGMEYSDSQL